MLYLDSSGSLDVIKAIKEEEDQLVGALMMDDNIHKPLSWCDMCEGRKVLKVKFYNRSRFLLK